MVMSKQAYAHMMSPHGVGGAENADAVGRSGQEGQGPFYVIYLSTAGNRIASASFRTIGCPWSNGVGSALTRLVEGKTAREACLLTEADVEKELGGIPRDKIHYLPLVVQALRDALGQFVEKQGNAS